MLCTKSGEALVLSGSIARTPSGAAVLTADVGTPPPPPGPATPHPEWPGTCLSPPGHEERRETQFSLQWTVDSGQWTVDMMARAVLLSCLWDSRKEEGGERMEGEISNS